VITFNYGFSLLYVRQGSGYAITLVCLSFSLSVCLRSGTCLSFCVQDYCKKNQPISLKLRVMIEPTNRKN